MKSIRFTDAVTLALHTMVLLVCDPSQRWTTQRIALKLEASPNHLAKIHTRLVNHGLLKSRRGPSGGLILGKSADEITLLDIYECIEGPLPAKSCLLDHPVCGRQNCIFGNLFDSINEQIKTYFSKTRLSDLTDETINGIPG